jgi:signal transduction histidine kinase
MELALIGQAVGDLGERLAQATEERAVLTRRLLEIRNDERRALARDLHDEFGQNLTAILAFASTIEASSAQQQAKSQVGSQVKSDVAGRANDLQSTLRIMACLRDTLTRLRHPPAEEPEACLVSLVDSWRSQNATQPMIQPTCRAISPMRAVSLPRQPPRRPGMPDQLVVPQRCPRDRARIERGRGQKMRC